MGAEEEEMLNCYGGQWRGLGQWRGHMLGGVGRERSSLPGEK